MLRNSRRMLSALVLLVALVFLATAVQRLDIQQMMIALRRARSGWLLLATISFASILPLWASEWIILASPDTRVGWRNMFVTVAATSSVLNTAPLLLGESAGVALLVTHSRLSRRGAFAVLAMDQLLVGVAKLALLALAASMVSLPGRLRSSAVLLLCAITAFALVAAVIMARTGTSARDSIVQRWLREAALALQSFRTPRIIATTLALALIKKVVEIVALVCIQRAFGLALPLASAVLLLAALNVATIVPVIPGNAAIYEATVVWIYASFGMAPAQALGLALVQHAAYFMALAVPGYLCMPALRARVSAAAAA